MITILKRGKKGPGVKTLLTDEEEDENCFIFPFNNELAYQLEDI